MPFSLRYFWVPAVATIVEAGGLELARWHSRISGLSSSRTETNTVPSRGTLLPAPICDLGEGHGVVGVEADDFAGRLHLGAEHGVDAGEAVEGEHGFLDRDVLESSSRRD